MKNYNYQEPENTANKIFLVFCFILFIFLTFLLIYLFVKNSHIDTYLLNKVDMEPFAEPKQSALAEKDKSTRNRTNRGIQVEIIPQAAYKIYGRIYTKHHVPAYIELGEIMPYDMVIAWGKMAKPEMFKMVKFEYEFYDRYVWWTFNKKIQGDSDELSICFSNNHIIPANKRIRKEFDKIKVKDIVYMEGFLVNLIVHEKSGLKKMDTSLWRDDDGPGACEIFYVTRLVTHNGSFK